MMLEQLNFHRHKIKKKKKEEKQSREPRLKCLMCVYGCSISKSCPTLCDPMDCSPPGSSVHGIFIQNPVHKCLKYLIHNCQILETAQISFQR